MSAEPLVLARRRYHQSEIATFLKCPKQWEFRYVQGLKTPPRAALTVGSSVDAAVTHNLIEKLKTGTDLPTQSVLDAYSTDFDTKAKETEWGDDDHDNGDEWSTPCGDTSERDHDGFGLHPRDQHLLSDHQPSHRRHKRNGADYGNECGECGEFDVWWPGID